MTLRVRPRRTWLATTLVAIAVAAPCTAWYVVGSAAAEREATAIRSRPMERGTQVARALADRLVGRLEAMRDSESQRPHYHFQSSYHDPTTTCSCAGSTPSPLATGPRDPFVDVYFEIDTEGRISVPVLGDLGGLEPEADRFQRASERRVALRPHAPELVQLADSGREPIAGGRTLSTTLGSEFTRRPLPVYAESFLWHGFRSVDPPILVALRRTDVAVQGFVLSNAAVSEWLRSAELPAVLRPKDLLLSAGDDPRDTRDDAAPVWATADVPLDCTTWEIAVDVGEPVALAGIDAARIETDFLRSFSIGSIAALVAALSVVVLLLNAERVARQRSRFAAAAAHELRTPLAGLRLYGEMLSTSTDDPDKAARYAQRIAAESERLSRVVTNVLDFSRLERGNVSVRLADGDLAASLRSIATRIEPALASQDAQLIVDLPAFAPARFDPDALDHIVQNLVDNAEKYARGFDDRRVHLTVERSDDRWALSVRDHGPGVSDAAARRLFEPFGRGDDPDQAAGLGLGLALVDRLARAHGAGVEWENAPDGGALFTVGFDAASTP